MTETQAILDGAEQADRQLAPSPVATNTVPAGYVIEYFTEPKRKYEIDGEEAVSVTTALNCLDKPALPWWGMKVGVEGVIALIEAGLLTPATNPITNLPTLQYDFEGHGYVVNVDAIVKLLTSEKMTVNHVRDKAASRGLNAHDAFEAWCITGEVPTPTEFPLEEQGYVQSLVNFIRDTEGKLHAEAQEVIVGSKEHLFAGRYDLRASTSGDMKLVTSALTTSGTPRKRGPFHTVVPGGSKLLIDLKTSKGVYASHLLQLEGYEGASIESGYEPTDARAVLHVTEHGLYEFKRARATYEDFLAILHTYHALARTEEALKS